jgi:hypothetical protein
MIQGQQAQIIGAIQMHTAQILALSAIIAAMPDKSKLDKELIKKKINAPGLIDPQGTEYTKHVRAFAEAHVERILKGE